MEWPVIIDSSGSEQNANPRLALLGPESIPLSESGPVRPLHNPSFLPLQVARHLEQLHSDQARKDLKKTFVKSSLSEISLHRDIIKLKIPHTPRAIIISLILYLKSKVRPSKEIVTRLSRVTLRNFA